MRAGLTLSRQARPIASKMLAENLALFAMVGAIVLHSGCLHFDGSAIPCWCIWAPSATEFIYIITLYLDCGTTLPFTTGGPRTCLVDLFKLGVSIALAMLSWHVVERPILELKEWFSYQPSERCLSVEIPSQVADLGSVKVG